MKKRTTNKQETDKEIKIIESETSTESSSSEDESIILEKVNSKKKLSDKRPAKTSDTGKGAIKRNKDSEEKVGNESKDQDSLDLSKDKKNKRDKNEKKEKKLDEKETNLRDQIDALQRQIFELTTQLNQTDNATKSNTEGIVIHKQIREIENKKYDKIKKIVASEGPKLELKVAIIDKAKPFTSPLKIKELDKIPAFFSIAISGKASDTARTSNTNAPMYIKKSVETFGFGINEARFVLKSVNLPHSIEFTPGSSSHLFKNVVGKTNGPVNIESSKMDYVLKIFETLFQMFLGCQFILTNVELVTQFDRDSYAGDLVSTRSMLRKQYVDQDVPLLPTAGYGHPARYLSERLNQLFDAAHHHMVIGETGRDIMGLRKIFRKVGVITDQYLAESNVLYLNYLFSRSIDATSFIAQHRALTMQTVSCKVDNPSVFINSLVPVWRREESDGSLLIYALDVDRQKLYLNHLTELLSSINLLSFATMDDILEMPPRRQLRDPDIMQLLDNLLNNSKQYDVFRALSADMTTTWIDSDLVINVLGSSPLDMVFKIFGILLWFIYFPSTARDNVPKLMFELFTALEMLSPSVERYIHDVGFCTLDGRRSTIQEFPKERYLSGHVRYPILTHRPAARYGILCTIHEIITGVGNGAIVRTVDADTIQTPRMSNIRHYYQPYQRLAAISNAEANGENRNECGDRIRRVITVLHHIIVEYKNKYKDYTNRSAFGTSSVSIAELLAFFDGMTPSILASIGIRSHAEIFALREVAANSPYVIDCQNLGFANLERRPQVLFELENGNWAPVVMQRYLETLPFELPIFMFFALRGAYSVETITPPDSCEQFQRLQQIMEEGILCGDVIRYVNNLKFGNIGVFNREALGISNVITAARADRIYEQISKLAELKQFSDLFTVLINEVSQRIDSRALNFKICMQQYHSMDYDLRIQQPADSLYNVPLRLGRTFMDDVMTLLSPLFVPETSPVALYTNGVLLRYDFVSDLDPFAYQDLQAFAPLIDRIVMWSPEMVTKRTKDGIRFIDESILRLPNDDGGFDEYVVGDNVPRTLIIVNAQTGPIAPPDFDVLYRFFCERKVCLLFPEVMMILEREMVEPTCTEDLHLSIQLRELATGLPNRRTTVVFGDTISLAYRLSSSTQKLKCIYPISPINQRDVILRGVNDMVVESGAFQIGSWMSWAYGGQDGHDITVVAGERYRNRLGIDEENRDGNQTIAKTELGMVNMNNNVRILTMPEYISMPKLIQDTSRAYVGIYTEV